MIRQGKDRPGAPQPKSPRQPAAPRPEAAAARADREGGRLDPVGPEAPVYAPELGKPFLLQVTAAQEALIEEYRWKHRLASRSAALRALIERGLKE